MKQHITPKQAKEITEEQFHTLFSNQHWSSYRRENWADYHHKKVTMGKMMELLDYRCFSWNLSSYYNGDIEEQEFYLNVCTNGLDSYHYKNIILCDLLWEAVVEVLIKK